MAPKRKGGARKAAATADKPSEDVEKQEVSAFAEEAIAAEVEEDKSEAERSLKKTKAEEKKTRGRQPKAAAEKAVAAGTKKNAEDNGKELGKDEEDAVDEEAPGRVEAKVIVIEASKECNSFKTRAAKVQAGLTKALPGIEVLINPDKPRLGCFEVRGKEGNIYLSLLGLPRPFTKLKCLDMDKVVEDIVAKVK